MKQWGNDDTTVSFTLREGPMIQALEEGLGAFDAQATVEAVEQGVTIVKVIGVYAELMKAINSILIQGVGAILANDEVSQALLGAVPLRHLGRTAMRSASAQRAGVEGGGEEGISAAWESEACAAGGPSHGRKS